MKKQRITRGDLKNEDPVHHTDNSEKLKETPKKGKKLRQKFTIKTQTREKRKQRRKKTFKYKKTENTKGIRKRYKTRRQ